MPSNDLIAIRTLFDTYDVELALSALRAAGIEAFAQATDSNRPYLAQSGVKIIVREEDAERARNVLAAV